MIRVRCPHCATIFRASPDVLKQRAGKVRCGKCNEVFNGLDCLLTEPPTVEVVVPLTGFALAPSPAAPLDAVVAEPPEPGANEIPAEDTPTDAEMSGAGVAGAPDENPGDDKADEGEGATEATEAAVEFPEPPTAPPDAPKVAIEPAPADEISGPASAAADPVGEAQEAGLMAARDLTELPGYSKWAEGTLSAPGANFEEPHKAGWMMALLVAVLSLMLLVQALHYWRTEIANRWPQARPWLEEACAAIECQVPYPRDAGQIHLEASDLQVDPERNNMLVLNLTLKNRAPYPQDYPAVELTLTDARDQVVVRRGLAPAEWLPPKLDGAAPPPAFPAEREIAARLWVDANGTGAVGYRLYVYYP